VIYFLVSVLPVLPVLNELLVHISITHKELLFSIMPITALTISSITLCPSSPMLMVRSPISWYSSQWSHLYLMFLQATFYESKGMGKGEKYTVSYGKGSGTQRMAYSSRTIVISIVDDDNKVKEAVSAIKQAASTGTSSGGIVTVSSIDELTVI
jgi:nitrogen regulatory protein PII